jgi:DnaJ-domain-containing protein 1
MIASVRKHREVLKRLHRARPLERRKIVKQVDCSLVKCLCTLCHQVLKGVIHLSKTDRSRLHKHRNVLRKLARPGESYKKKFEILQQGSGFLPLLLAPLITGIFSKIFN